MTTLPTIGVDIMPGTCRTARVNMQTGRPKIDMMLDAPAASLIGDEVLAGSRVVCGVPDDQVLVKSVYLSDLYGADAYDLARFELVASLLEPESAFEFKILDTGLERRYLGLIFRKERLASFTGDLKNAGGECYRWTNYQSRGVALGQGYLTFCAQRGGDLVCVGEISDGTGSVCFINRGHIVGLANLQIRGDRFDSDDWLKRLAIEFKTVINFRLSALSSEGVSVPLSALFLTGARVDERVRSVFSGYFPAGVLAPQINRAFLQDSAEAVERPEAFLVPLGLALN